jgi:dTDP-4-dehydrorhamnose 3,5-epimerase
MINGVKIKKLKPIYDDRGHLMEILRNDDECFEKFGQVYMTTAKPGIVKAWHYHENQTDNFSCVYGKICLALYDARKESPTFGEVNEFILSIDEPKLIQIPALVYHGFKCMGQDEAIVINTPTKAYNHSEPDELRVDAYDNEIPYDWKNR